MPKLLLIYVIVYLLPAITFGQLSRIDSLFSKSVSEDLFSGVVLIAKNDSIVYHQAFGYSNIKDTKLNTVSTAFSIASVGKVFTATIIMKLVEEGKINLSDTIDKFITNVDIPGMHQITINHLLTHTSGLGNYMTHPDYLQMSANAIQIHDLLPLIAAQPLTFDPAGLRHEYSNSGYIILGRIIEIVTKKNYEAVLNETIFKSLEITSAQMVTDRQSGIIARGYWKPSGQGEWVSAEASFPVPLSDGGIFISASDLLKFSQALYAGKIIEKETLMLMIQKHAEGIQPGTGKIYYGYGLMISDFGINGTSWGHNGGSPGYGAEFRHYQIGADSYTLIILANHDRVIRPLFFKVQEMIAEGKI